MTILRQRWKTVSAWLMAVMLCWPANVKAEGEPSLQWCLRTDQGQYIEMARVSMLVAVDGQETFEVVVLNGQGAVDVKSVTFELHESDYVPPQEDELSPDELATGPWCLITDQNDSIAMSRVQMLANVDGSNKFEVVTTDGANRVGVTNVRFGRGQTDNSGGFVPIDPNASTPTDPNRYNPWCMITDKNDTIAMSRVQLLANVDQASKFEIVTSDGDNRLNVSFVRFAHGDSKTAGGFVPVTSGTTPTDPNRYNPWCMITDRKDTIAMSRVQMVANIDGDNTFEIITSDQQNVSGVQFVRFAHGDSKTAGGFVPIKPGDQPDTNPGTGPWCLITDSNDSIAMGRVSMIAHVDANGLFEIVTKYGVGAESVKNIRFARGLNALSGGFDPNYTEDEPGSDQLPGPLYLITNDEREQPMSNVAMLANADGQGKFEVVLHVGNNLTGVEYVTFRVGEGNVIRSTRTERVLTLLTPVHFELKLSGCDGATEAMVYDLNGRLQAKALVSNGTTTISVAHMPDGIYIVKVGNKSLKFTKE